MSITRRDFLVNSALVAIAAAIARPTAAGAWQNPPAGQTPSPSPTPTPAQPVFTPIRRNIGTFTMRGGTIGYLVDPHAVVVVDSQYPAEGKVCLDGINARSNNRPVDLLINTHHHLDHMGGNISFKGVTKHVVSQAKAAEMMPNPPGAAPLTGEQLYPDTTFAETWSADPGNELLRAKYYGVAHTSGDVVVTFERANVAHMGDLLFNQRHAIIDRAAGASIKGWIAVLDRVPKDHSSDTIYICGHVGTNMPVTCDRKELKRFRDYLEAVLDFVGKQIKAGKSREEILAMRDPLKGFETFGRFPAANPRDPLTVAYEELTVG
jgi:glyoxylase-like metal-dependent hydrolase (beta-lactamase superfamily II)